MIISGWGGIMKKLIVVVFALLPACGVSLSGNKGMGLSGLPRTPGELATNYGYVPLDGLAVETVPAAGSCKEAATGAKPQFKSVLQSLPDISVRLAISSRTQNGNLGFGPVTFTEKGGTYRAVLDYVNADVVPMTFAITAFDGVGWRPLANAVAMSKPILGYQAKWQDDAVQDNASSGTIVTFPVYVGVGMRLTADITALEGKIELTSLAGIGAAAQAKAVSGIVTVQTIGVNTQLIGTALPLPSKLDDTTMENSIMSLATGRMAMYTADAEKQELGMAVRVVGLYTPVGSDPTLINAIYGELSRRRPKWYRPCTDGKPPVLADQAR